MEHEYLEKQPFTEKAKKSEQLLVEAFDLACEYGFDALCTRGKTITLKKVPALKGADTPEYRYTAEKHTFSSAFLHNADPGGNAAENTLVADAVIQYLQDEYGIERSEEENAVTLQNFLFHY